MGGFTKAPIRVEQLPVSQWDSPNNPKWRLLSAIEYSADSEGSGKVILVPPGFEHDFASIPRCVHSIIPKNGVHDKAAIIHDWLYATEFFSWIWAFDQTTDIVENRAQCDWIFLEAMQVLKVSWLRRNVMYKAVRWGGESVWAKHDPMVVAANRNLLFNYMNSCVA